MAWLQKGAQPTDTTRRILSYKGILYKKHLQKGVAKGVLTQEQADTKHEVWLTKKEGTISEKRTRVTSKKQEQIKNRLVAESKLKEAKTKILQAKQSSLSPDVIENTASAEAPAIPAAEQSDTTSA